MPYNDIDAPKLFRPVLRKWSYNAETGELSARENLFRVYDNPENGVIAEPFLASLPSVETQLIPIDAPLPELYFKIPEGQELVDSAGSVWTAPQTLYFQTVTADIVTGDHIEGEGFVSQRIFTYKPTRLSRSWGVTQFVEGETQQIEEHQQSYDETYTSCAGAIAQYLLNH